MSQFFTEDENLDKKYETAIIKNKKISHFQVNRDYMPFKALLLQRTYIIEREDRTYILEGNVEIVEEKKENLYDEIIIKNATKDTVLELPYYYYPGYDIEIEKDNKIEKLESIESKNGFLSCVLHEDIEEGTIRVKYVGTTITYISYIISAISFITFIIYIRYEKKKGEANDKN